MNIGGVIYHTVFCKNSMDWAKSLLSEAPHGSLFLADIHGAPRGRQGRVWHFDHGQLLLTFTLKPAALPAGRAASLFMAISCGLLKPFLRYSIQIKWPNDFVYENKKIAGILMESVWQGNDLQGIIVGAGFNVNNLFQEDHFLYDKATSLRQIIGHFIDREVLIKEVCVSLNASYDAWNAGNDDILYANWQHHQAYRGSLITVHEKSGALLKGFMKDVLPNGNMVLVDHSGYERVVSFQSVEYISV